MPHDDAVVVWQVPVPLQVRAGVNVDPEQLCATQIVPLAYSRQAPPPSQAPSVPQVEAPLSAHWPRGSAPAGQRERPFHSVGAIPPLQLSPARGERACRASNTFSARPSAAGMSAPIRDV